MKLDEGRLPQLYAIGIKELWEMPQGRLAPGTVIHTLGYPLKMEEFGGAFIYAMPDGLTSIGLVAGLDYRDPMFDPHVDVPAPQAASVRRVAADGRATWSATAPRRCPKAAGTRSRASMPTAC